MNKDYIKKERRKSNRILQERSRILCYMLCLICFSCMSKRHQPDFIGERKICYSIEPCDSFLIVADSISWEGNFFSMDNSLYFIDRYYCNLFMFDWDSGFVVDKMLGHGHSESEVIGVNYAYPLNGSKHSIVIVDNDCKLSIYDTSQRKVKKSGYIIVQDNTSKSQDYASPQLYNLMELDEFGVDFFYKNSNEIIIPVNLINRKLKKINSSRYDKGHIWGCFNFAKNRIIDVFGTMPCYYYENPSPNFEHFRCIEANGHYYVNHTVDSLIYVYNHNLDQILCTFGYEAKDAVRT